MHRRLFTIVAVIAILGGCKGRKSVRDKPG